MEEKKRKSKGKFVIVIALVVVVLAAVICGGVKLYQDNRITATPSHGEIVSILSLELTEPLPIIIRP